MKRAVTFLGVLVVFMGISAFAQRPMDTAEKDVHIVQGPEITHVTGHSASIRWVTNAPGANHVRYRIAGSHDQWQSAYHQGGGREHALELSNLEPGRTYEWQILTRDGDMRKEGTFQTEGHEHR